MYPIGGVSLLVLIQGQICGTIFFFASINDVILYICFIIIHTQVDGDWLIYYNHLVLCPAVPSTTRGSLMLNHVTTLIPVECHYKR